MSRPLSSPEQQKEATRRCAQGGTLQRIRVQLRPQHIHHAMRHQRRTNYFPSIRR
jgi:hypothetical protein